MLFFRHYTTFFHCIPNYFPSKFLFFIISYFHILHPFFQTIKKAVLDLAFPLVDKQQKRLYFFYIYKKGRLEFFFLKSASIFFLFSFVLRPLLYLFAFNVLSFLLYPAFNLRTIRSQRFSQLFFQLQKTIVLHCRLQASRTSKLHLPDSKCNRCIYKCRIFGFLPLPA